MLKKHVITLAAAGAMALGATAVSAAPVRSNAASLKAAHADGMTQVNYKRHRAHARVHQSQNWRVQRSQNWNGPFGAPFAAAAGVGAVTGAIVGGALSTTGAIVGGTTAAVTGYPNGYGAYGSYAYAPDPYGSYAYAPGPYGVSRDIGNGYYNGFAAPASQDNCAGDGGYGRRDYAIGC